MKQPVLFYPLIMLQIFFDKIMYSLFTRYICYSRFQSTSNNNVFKHKKSMDAYNICNRYKVSIHRFKSESSRFKYLYHVLNCNINGNNFVNSTRCIMQLAQIWMPSRINSFSININGRYWILF